MSTPRQRTQEWGHPLGHVSPRGLEREDLSSRGGLLGRIGQTIPSLEPITKVHPPPPAPACSLTKCGGGGGEQWVRIGFPRKGCIVE